MKKLTFITLFLLATLVVMGQASKPRKVTIKKSITISKDSTYYLPDTIACVFQELVIKPDTIYTKWNKAFVIWQVWNDNYWGGLASISGNTWIGTGILTGTVNNEPHKHDYPFSQIMPGSYLYPDKTKVTNKVIQSY